MLCEIRRKRIFRTSYIYYSYTDKYIYSKPNDDGWCSIIAKYDANNKFLSGTYYSDNNYTELGTKIQREYNTDNSYIDKYIYTKPHKDGWCSTIEEYDANNNFTSATRFFDNNFTELGLKKQRKYNPDNSYTDKYIYSKPTNDGWRSIITKSDSNGKNIC